MRDQNSRLFLDGKTGELLCAHDRRRGYRSWSSYTIAKTLETIEPEPNRMVPMETTH
jgi:hypothetical protein